MEDQGKYQVDGNPDQPSKPVAWQFFQDGEWWNGDDRIKDHRKNTEEAGFPIRDLIVLPTPQQCGPVVDQRTDVQGEPTDDELLNWAAEEQLFLLCEDDDFLQIAREVLHKYGSRSPAVQGEPVARVKTVGGYLEVSEHVVEWLCKHKDLKDGDYLYLVQQPTPDVSALVGALRMLVVAGSRLNDDAEECMHDDGMAEVAGSECWCEFRDALEAATEALAAHRKGGES